MVTAKVKAVNKGLSRVRKAMDQDENPLSVAEVDFVQTCCRILGIDSKEKIDSICKRALADGKGNVRKTMSAITNLLDELGWEAKKHKREAPGPSLTTWPWDDMDVPTCSLQHLKASVKGVRDVTIWGFAREIKISKLNLESSIEDFRVTVERTGMAAKWDKTVINDWIEKGRTVCGDIIREATAALEKAEAREVEEVMVWLMETTREELIDLASKVEDQAEEAEPGLLIELGEEMSTGETTRQAWPGCWRETSTRTWERGLRGPSTSLWKQQGRDSRSWTPSGETRLS
jgi:hypothetical protein